MTACKVELDKNKKRTPPNTPVFEPHYTRPRNVLSYYRLLCPEFKDAKYLTSWHGPLDVPNTRK